MTDARASRVAVEALTALAPPRRISRTHAEALVGQAPPRNASGVRVEVLHAYTLVPQITGTVAATLPRLGARITAATGPGPRTGTLAVALPKLRAASTGTNTPPARPGALVGALPKMRAAVAVLVRNPRRGAVSVTLPNVAGHLAGYAEGPSARLPALTAELYGTVPVVIATDTTWANDGYTYTGTAEVDYDPAVADPPPHLHRQDVRRVHQSLPTPTLVRGRPQ